MGFYSEVIFPRPCDLLMDRPFVAKHRQRLLATAYGDVLEIGFGTGLNLHHYPAQVRKITTVDPNAGMHRLAQKRIRRSKIEVDQRILSGERLPFEDDLFDCAVSTFTLCSIEDVGQALSEMYRVLSPGGKLLIFDSFDTGFLAEQLRAAGAKEVTLSPWSFPALIPHRTLCAGK